jgi:DNA-binding NarL/FixJ family response regulator
VTTRKTQNDEARTRSELAKTRREQARTRAELVKTGREQAKTRVELAKTRTEQIKTRAELAKSRKNKTGLQAKEVKRTLQRVVHKEFDVHKMKQQGQAPAITIHSLQQIANHKSSLGRLSSRQREILRLIAESQNTKEIAEILKVSTKTIEYHRGKLMSALNVHDVPGLVRFALRVGLIHPEG